MNATATNYNENATLDDGSCVYPPPPEPPVDDDPSTPIDDASDEDSSDTESESPQKFGIIENISIEKIALGVVLVLLLGMLLLLQLGSRASTNRHDRIR
jgi:hypothetical protein